MSFREGKIIEKFRGKDGREIIIRYPKMSDLKEVRKFYNRVIGETQFLSRITPVTLKEERKWLTVSIQDNEKKKSVSLFAECGGKIVGSGDIHLPFSESDRHVGNYGIAILQEYTGMGIGTRMSRQMISLAKRDLKIEIVKLSVYDKNRIALGLYRKLGFRYAGKIPRGVKHGKKYMDNIIMYKVLKS